MKVNLNLEKQILSIYYYVLTAIQSNLEKALKFKGSFHSLPHY